jgi:hypothetical protein
MALSCFGDRASRPTRESLAGALGSSSALWAELIEHIAARHPPLSEEWAFAGAQYGWSLRLVQKKRRVVYLIPQSGSFLAGVVLGEKAVRAANESSLPEPVLSQINSAKQYAEGRGIRLRVERREDLEHVERLVEIKLES